LDHPDVLAEDMYGDEAEVSDSEFDEMSSAISCQEWQVGPIPEAKARELSAWFRQLTAEQFAILATDLHTSTPAFAYFAWQRLQQSRGLPHSEELLQQQREAAAQALSGWVEGVVMAGGLPDWSWVGTVLQRQLECIQQFRELVSCFSQRGTELESGRGAHWVIPIVKTVKDMEAFLQSLTSQALAVMLQQALGFVDMREDLPGLDMGALSRLLSELGERVSADMGGVFGNEHSVEWLRYHLDGMLGQILEAAMIVGGKEAKELVMTFVNDFGKRYGLLMSSDEAEDEDDDEGQRSRGIQEQREQIAAAGLLSPRWFGRQDNASSSSGRALHQAQEDLDFSPGLTTTESARGSSSTTGVAGELATGYTFLGELAHSEQQQHQQQVASTPSPHKSSFNAAAALGGITPHASPVAHHYSSSRGEPSQGQHPMRDRSNGVNDTEGGGLRNTQQQGSRRKLELNFEEQSDTRGVDWVARVDYTRRRSSSCPGTVSQSSERAVSAEQHGRLGKMDVVEWYLESLSDHQRVQEGSNASQMEALAMVRQESGQWEG
jgi:hypothetical protein